MTRRLDRALFDQGLALSRTHARRIVDEGRARINGRVASRAAAPVNDADLLTVVDAPEGGEYASRAAHKLDGALTALGLAAEISGSHALDLGASTGGFTDVLLRRGARHVHAVDVGHGQLIDRLAQDPRVTSLERTDARSVTPGMLGGAPGVIVSDVSFISLTALMPAVERVAAPGALVLLMVKPQFEAGRGAVPKSGVITDPGVWRSAVERVAQAAEQEGLQVCAVEPSPLAGQDGNREFFLVARAGSDPHSSAVRESESTSARCDMIERAVDRARRTDG